jgi:3-oxoacyl-[acyl-carrier protein] reductase
MDLGLEGKLVLVTGATGDLGRAAAQLLSAEGAHIAVAGRNRSMVDNLALELTSGTGTAMGFEADLSSSGPVTSLIDSVEREMGPIYGVVNTVGPISRNALDGVPQLYREDELWQFHFDQVLMPTVRICREVMPLMKERRSGSIINFAALSARHYFGYLGAYAAMKAAVAHVSKNYARDGAEYGVRVNCIHPGWIYKDKIKDQVRETMSDRGLSEDEVVDEILSNMSDNQFYSKRLGEPAEYAQVIAFLLSEKASYVNSVWLPVDGGSAPG